MDLYRRVQEMAIEGQYEEVLEQLDNPANAESVGQCVLEVVRFLGNEYLSDEDQPLDLVGDTVDFCERAFAILARVAKPKEVLLGFLEMLTCVRRDIRLRLMLPPTQTVLIRVLPVEKRGKELAWFIHTLDSVLEQTPIPPNYGLEGEEQQFVQVDNTVEQISNNLEELVQFYQPFVLDFSNENTNEDLKKTRKTLATSIIHVFEFMLTYVDLSQRLAELAKKLVWFLCHLEHDLLTFVSYLSAKSLATLFYVVQARSVYRERLFCVYSNRYMLELSLPMSRCLLDNSHEFSIQKGISLLESVVNLIGLMELEESALEMDEFASVTRSLVNVMITNSVLTFRKQSVKLLIELIDRFERCGRYTFYVRLLNGVRHSGVQELIICEFKKNLHQVLMDGKRREMDCFVGCGLERALRLMTRLPKGAETDLIDERERVLAALNLLIYLLRRDGPDVNVTGVWNMIESVEEKFVKPLQSAIDLSRAHFTAELDHQREVERGTASDRDQPEVSMSVQGLPLPQLPTKQKIETIQSMLTGIDLIQSVVSYVCQLIYSKPL